MQAAAAPLGLTAIIRFPEFEFVPEPLRGRHAISPLPTSMMALIHSDPTDPLPAWDLGGRASIGVPEGSAVGGRVGRFSSAQNSRKLGRPRSSPDCPL